MKNKKEESKQETNSENTSDKPPAVHLTPPTKEEKKAARPVKRALKKALEEVDSKEKADEVAAELEAVTSDAETQEVAQTTRTPTSVKEAAQKVEKAVEKAPDGETAKKVLTETARQVVASEGRDREVLSEVVQEAMNPEQVGGKDEKRSRRRDLLRDAILRRMAPYDAFDARLFLAINHLPHSEFTNRFFYYLTYIFNGGFAWYVILALAWIFDRQHGKKVVQSTAIPLTLSTMTVEFPIKSYFRRKRPFINIVQAIVIGKKPGTWSFPSGHSASAFAGAWLLSKHYPKQRSLLYLIAALVAFSRIFLGDHYPGDVVAGSVTGTLLAKWVSKMQDQIRR